MLEQNDIAIEVKDVKKKFKIYYDKGKMLKERMLFKSRNRYEINWVLNGISFQVKRGEAIGLIGHNGCGKSTTLKLLTGIMYPDFGEININGRISSLIELGAGFHPDLSGRENIYINASIFGLSKKEIDKRLADIIAFSELEESIDNPVRTYSSGMYMRLAFSVAINVDADVLLIDEILAVGDVNFQAKCFNKLMEIKKNGTTIVIVSHSMGQIEQICDRCIWIHQGLIKEQGKTREISQKYLEYMGEKRQESADKNGTEEEVAISENEQDTAQEENQPIKRIGSGEARIEYVKTYNHENLAKNTFINGDDIAFEIKYKVHKSVSNVVFGLSIFRIDGVRCYGTNTRVDRLDVFNLENDGSIRAVFPKIELLEGKYFVDVCIEASADNYVDFYYNACEFEVFSPADDIGVIRMPHKWQIL